VTGEASTSGAQAEPALDAAAAFDILRGMAALTDRAIVADFAHAVGKFPRADLAIALNHKQIGSKLWLRDRLVETLGDAAGGKLGDVLILGGWHGVLAAILLDDARLDIAHVTSLDLDPGCEEVARAINRRAVAARRFSAATGDMFAFDYASARADLVINTSCEHLADVAAWVALLPKGQRVVLQSNDYFREPDHVSCVESLAAFQAQARLAETLFAGQWPTKNYTRFMQIGRV